MALYRIKENLYFYHVPKTGGRAFLTNENCPRGKGHQVVSAHKKGQKILVNLRCPVDRFLSCYYMFSGFAAPGRPEHREQQKLIKKTPLKTIDYFVDRAIQVDQLAISGGAHLSTQYRWHKNLRSEDVIYVSFNEFKKKSKIIEKFTSKRPLLANEPELKKIIQKVKLIYSKDYEYFESIPEAVECLKEWL